MTRRMSIAQQRRRTVEYLQRERVTRLREVYNALMRELPAHGAAREWADELGLMLNFKVLKWCPRCEGHGEHRRKEDCDCYDPYHCEHAEKVTCRRCRGIGFMIVDKEMSDA